MRTTMRGTSLLVSVLVGGASSWFTVPVALTATGAPSRTTNRSSVDSAVARRCLLVQFIDGCGRPCAHAGTWFAVLDKVVYMPVASNDWCFGFTVQKTVEFPQLHVDVSWCSSSTVVDVPVLTQRRGLQFLDKVFGLPVVQRQVLGVDSAVLFIVRVLDIPVMPLSRYAQCKLCSWCQILQVQFLGLSTCPLLCLTSA